MALTLQGKKANNTQTYTMTYKKINEHIQIQKLHRPTLL